MLKLGDQEQCIEIIAKTPGQTISRRALSISEVDGTRSPTSPKSMSDDQTIVLSNNNGSTIVHVELNIDDQFTFLKAICHKKSFSFENCQKEYRKLETTF